MKISKLLSVIIACIVLLSGCSAGTVAPGPLPLPSDDGAAEITIEVDDTADFYGNAARRFEELTGVKVNVINHYSAEQTIDDKDYAYLDRIPGELMAGKGADIYTDINLDFTKIGRQGYLCNLAEWIAADPDFSDKTYYMNILESGFDKGDVYSFPLTMTFQALETDVEIPELDGKNLNWEECIELIKGINRNGVLFGLTDQQIFMRRFKERYESFVDNENKTQNLNTPELIQLLEQSKTWSKQGLCISYNEDNNASVFLNSYIKVIGGGIDLLTNSAMANTTEATVINGEMVYSTGGNYFYDIPSDSGISDKSNKVLESDCICVNASSPHKGTAWKFVKFLLSENIQATSYLFPINRKAAAVHIRKTFNLEFSDKSNNADEVIKEAETLLDAINEIPNRTKTDLEKIISNEAVRYFTNEISAEAAAKNMADAVALYLKEQ